MSLLVCSVSMTTKVEMVAEHIPPAVEAILLVAEDPLPPELLAQLVGSTPIEMEEVCSDLAKQYEAEGRGFILKRVAGGYRYQTAADQTPYVERYVLEGQSSRLSAAALETLAVVAYKQPVSRNQIAAIRGVNVDGVVRTLQVRGYIDEVRRDPGPGHAVLYGTTPSFLERMGLDSVSELLPLGEFFPTSEVVEALERGLHVVPDDEPPDDQPFAEDDEGYGDAKITETGDTETA